MDSGNIKWHPAYCSGMELELREYKSKLIFETEHLLSKEPIRVDMLIIKKGSDFVIENDIGRIFRRHNIVEFKSPDDALSIDDYSKAVAYATHYKATAKTVNEIPFDELTVTMLRESYPKEFFAELTRLGARITKECPGIYYVEGIVFFPSQIIVLGELDRKRNPIIKIVSKHIDREDIESFVDSISGLNEKGDIQNISSMLYVSMAANKEIYEIIRREERMRDMTIIKEIFPEFEEEKREAVRAAQEAARKAAQEAAQKAAQEAEIRLQKANKEAEIRLQKAADNNNLTSIKNLMETLRLTSAQAMDALKIPEALRKEYASRL